MLDRDTATTQSSIPGASLQVVGRHTNTHGTSYISPAPAAGVGQVAALEAITTRDLTNGIDAGYPLTKTGRKKRGSDDDLDEDDGYAVDAPEDSKHPYKSKAYHIRRAFSLFADIHSIMNDGIKRRAREALGISVQSDGIQSERDWETFKLITEHLDGLNHDIIKLKRKPKIFRKLVRGIRQAADQGRNNDTANLKRDIACMLTEDGACVLNAVRKGVRSSSKSDRGFYNDVMGRYLCPITLDWDDLRVRQEIRDGKHAIKANKLPRLLYANCECNVDDLEQGLGRNQALLRVVKYIFTGRSSAFSTTPGGKTTRAGNAALAGMKEITPRVVAYSACMLRFAISTEESWSKLDNEFNMEEFYWYIVDIFDDAQEFGRNLLAWWNMQVFGTSAESTSTDALTSDTDFISLLKQQRAAKRAKVLHISTNTAGHTTWDGIDQLSMTAPESTPHTRIPTPTRPSSNLFRTMSPSSTWPARPSTAFAANSPAASPRQLMGDSRGSALDSTSASLPLSYFPENRAFTMSSLTRATGNYHVTVGNTGFDYTGMPIGSTTAQPVATQRVPLAGFGSAEIAHNTVATTESPSYRPGTAQPQTRTDFMSVDASTSASSYRPTGTNFGSPACASSNPTPHPSSLLPGPNFSSASESNGYDALLKADALLRTQNQIGSTGNNTITNNSTSSSF